MIVYFKSSNIMKERFILYQIFSPEIVSSSQVALIKRASSYVDTFYPNDNPFQIQSFKSRLTSGEFFIA